MSFPLKSICALPLLLVNLAAQGTGYRIITVPPSMAIVASGVTTALGEVDSGVITKTQIRVVNLGSKAFKLVPPPQPEVRSVRVIYPTQLEVGPGEGVNLGVEVDARSNAGVTEVSAFVYTDDPGARALQAPISFTAVATSEARPYGDTFKAILSEAPPEKVVPIEFIPTKASGPFVKAWVEDPNAPVVFTCRQVVESGRIIGTVAIDAARYHNYVAGHGCVRIVGETADGHQNFVNIYWLFEK